MVTKLESVLFFNSVLLSTHFVEKPSPRPAFLKLRRQLFDALLGGCDLRRLVDIVHPVPPSPPSARQITEGMAGLLTLRKIKRLRL
jgi:hypothetical protein